MVCIIIYLLGQHPGFSRTTSTALKAVQSDWGMFACLKREEREELDQRGSACKWGVTCWEGSDGGDQPLVCVCVCVCFLQRRGWGVRHFLDSNKALKSGPGPGPGSLSGHIQSCHLPSRRCPLLVPPPPPHPPRPTSLGRHLFLALNVSSLSSVFPPFAVSLLPLFMNPTKQRHRSISYCTYRRRRREKFGFLNVYLLCGALWWRC